MPVTFLPYCEKIVIPKTANSGMFLTLSAAKAHAVFVNQK